MGKELLLRLGEETLHSAKGHFKACDLRRWSLNTATWVCFSFSIISLGVDNHSFDIFLKMGAVIASVGLLIWNEGNGKEYRSQQRQAGEKYLSLHKEIRECYFLTSCEIDHVQKLSQKVIDYDNDSSRPEIPWLARVWARYAVEKSGETDNWYKK